MKIGAIFLLISSLSMLVSCEDEQQGSVVIDTAIDMTFSDAAGNDLLDPDFAGSFHAADIDIFYLKDGQKERVYDPLMDSPENFFIYERGGKHYMRLFPNKYGEGMLTTTYLQLSETDTDTIKCQLRKLNTNSASVATDKVWYNDELVWDGQAPRELKIAK